MPQTLTQSDKSRGLHKLILFPKSKSLCFFACASADCAAPGLQLRGEVGGPGGGTGLELLGDGDDGDGPPGEVRLPGPHHLAGRPRLLLAAARRPLGCVAGLGEVLPPDRLLLL